MLQEKVNTHFTNGKAYVEKTNTGMMDCQVADSGFSFCALSGANLDSNGKEFLANTKI